MTTSVLNDKSWKKYPFTYRNNRGCVLTSSGRFIRYGIPEPKGKENDSDMKGGDRIGFSEITITPEMVGKKIAVFTNIEIKGDGDKLKTGQILWHNFVIKHGGISEIWFGNGDIESDELKV